VTNLDRTVYEDQASFIGGNIVVQDTESAAFGTPVTVTITAPSGTLGIGGADVNTSATASAAGSQPVTISGDNSGTLTLTGRASDIEALLNDAVLGLTAERRQRQPRPERRSGGRCHHHPASGRRRLAYRRHRAGRPGRPDAEPHHCAGERRAGCLCNGRYGLPQQRSGGSRRHQSRRLCDFRPDYTDGGNIADGETDFMQVTVRITDASGVPLTAAQYSNAGVSDITISSGNTTSGVTIDSVYNGSESALVIRGTLSGERVPGGADRLHDRLRPVERR
jgi:hypothetical protein